MLESVAIIFSLLCVWTTIKQNILCWVYGIFGVSAYFIIFLDKELYAEMTLQIIFFVQSLYGLYNWNYKGSALKVSKLNWTQTINYVFFMSLSIFICYFILVQIKSNLPLLDSFSAIMSLFANYFLTKKKIEAWYLWIVVDILLVCLFLNVGLIGSAILYFIFLILAIKGLSKWKKDLNQD